VGEDEADLEHKLKNADSCACFGDHSPARFRRSSTPILNIAHSADKIALTLLTPAVIIGKFTTSGSPSRPEVTKAAATFRIVEVEVKLPGQDLYAQDRQ
jgi:hypothetical protein